MDWLCLEGDDSYFIMLIECIWINMLNQDDVLVRVSNVVDVIMVMFYLLNNVVEVDVDFIGGQIGFFVQNIDQGQGIFIFELFFVYVMNFGLDNIYVEIINLGGGVLSFNSFMFFIE